MVKINILDLVFPKKCLGCGISGGYLCLDCVAKEKKIKNLCPYCLRPAIDGMTHSRCLRKKGLDALVCLWPYSGVLRQGLLALKYKFAEEIAQEMAQLAADEIRGRGAVFPSGASLVPIPLFWYKGNLRGFNQAEEIGKIISKFLGWKFRPDLLIRKSQTFPQVNLKRKERLTNLRGVFAVNPTYIKYLTSDNFVLFDDVWTTGATLKEAAMALKRKGAKSVWGLTLMRD